MNPYRFAAALLICTPLLRADAEKDVRDACRELAHATDYSWESMVSDPTPAVRQDSSTNAAGLTASSLSAGVTLRPAVKGRIFTNGTSYTKVTMPDGTIAQGVRQSDGNAVVLLGTDWCDINELNKEIGIGASSPSTFTKGRIDPRKTAILTAKSGSAISPGIELEHLLPGIASFREENGDIVGEFTREAASELLLPRHSNVKPETHGTITFHLVHGQLRQYLIRAEGAREVTTPGSGTLRSFTSPSRIELVTTLDYSGTGGPAEPPKAALAKLTSLPVIDQAATSAKAGGS